MGEKLYSSVDVSIMLGRTDRTIRKLAATHNIGQKVGPTYAFTDEDIQRLAAINPLGGRPRKDGKPIVYTAGTEAIKRRGPRR